MKFHLENNEEGVYGVVVCISTQMKVGDTMMQNIM